MRNKEFLTTLGIFLAVLIFFFSPFFFRGYLPFPGDLLVGQYAPWNASSFLGFAPGGVPHKAQGIDVIRQSFPWHFFSTQLLKQGQLPLWNPHNFAGTPHLANFQTAIFYPLNTLFLILNTNLAWSVFIIFQPLLTCLFTYLFLREIKLSRSGSVFASLAFAYCLYLTVWFEWSNIGHAILWLPLALFLIEKIVKELKLKWILFFIFSLVNSILAGYIQVTIYFFVVVYAYFFFRIIFAEKVEKKKKKIAVILTCGLLAGLICTVQILPTAEIFLHSAREPYSYQQTLKLLLPKVSLIGAFVPDFFGNPASRNYWLVGTYIERVLYIGVLPLFFALWAIFRQRKEKLVRFFIFLAVLVLFLTVNFFPANFFYRLGIPIISTTVPTRLLYVFSFALAILAAFGVEDYLKSKNHRPIKIAGWIFVGFYLFLGLFTIIASRFFPGQWWLEKLRISQRNLVLPTFFATGGAVILFFSDRINKKLIILVLTLITIFDLNYYFNKITPFSPPEFVYPQTEVMNYLKNNAGINRFWGYGTGYIDTNFSTLLGNYSIEGYDPLFIQRYGELISASDDGQIKRPIPRADVVLAKENYFRQQLLNLLGVKYILQKNEMLGQEWRPDYQTFPPLTYQLIWQKSHWQIYENKMALPRIFFLGQYRLETEGQKIVEILFSQEFNPKQKVILEEELSTDFVLAKNAGGEIIDLDYQPNRIEMKVNVSGNALLFLSDNYFPGWQATVDGLGTKIYRADYTFRAIPVPKGSHKIVFSYRPASLRLGAVISGISLVLVLILIGLIPK